MSVNVFIKARWDPHTVGSFVHGCLDSAPTAFAIESVASDLENITPSHPLFMEMNISAEAIEHAAVGIQDA